VNAAEGVRAPLYQCSLCAPLAVGPQVEGVTVTMDDSMGGSDSDDDASNGLGGIREIVEQINQAGNGSAITSSRYTGDINSLRLTVTVGGAASQLAALLCVAVGGAVAADLCLRQVLGSLPSLRRNVRAEGGQCQCHHYASAAYGSVPGRTGRQPVPGALRSFLLL